MHENSYSKHKNDDDSEESMEDDDDDASDNENEGSDSDDNSKEPEKKRLRTVSTCRPPVLCFIIITALLATWLAGSKRAYIVCMY